MRIFLHKKLNKASTVLIALVFFFLGVSGGYAQNNSPCVSREIALKGIFQAGYAYVGTFITDQHIVMQLFFAADGRWLIIGVTPDIDYCILIKGSEMALAFEREG